MCKHPIATIVNWYPISGHYVPDYQCDICGGFARYLEFEVDFDGDDQPTVDLTGLPLVDITAFDVWNKRTKKAKVITIEKRAELIELIKESI